MGDRFETDLVLMQNARTRTLINRIEQLETALLELRDSILPELYAEIEPLGFCIEEMDYIFEHLNKVLEKGKSND